MRSRYVLAPLAVLILSVAAARPLRAAGTYKLELVGEARGSALVFQQWLRALSQAGVKNVRIRSARATDKVGIEVRGSEDRPLYVVTGVIKSSDELIAPGGRYRRRDAAKLASWLNDLARLGPAQQGEQQPAFGLSPRQFEQLHGDLARLVTFSTQQTPRGQVVEKIGRQLLLPLRIDPEAVRALNADKVGEELAGISCGTALACVLRPMGYCLVPRRQGDGPACVVAKARPGLEIWPVGWESDKPRREALPALFEFHNVAVGGVSAAAALEAVGKRLKVPVLMDHNAMARHGIDPAKAIVSHPRSRTTYSSALRKILFQAGLKFEVRVDEAGNPFLWISTVKPV